jgi:hypothetical protein
MNLGRQSRESNRYEASEGGYLLFTLTDKVKGVARFVAARDEGGGRASACLPAQNAASGRACESAERPQAASALTRLRPSLLER